MAKPSSKLDWTVGNPNFGTITIEPTAPKKETGWGINERPPRETMNWLFYNVHEWIEYFETTTDSLLGIDAAYDAVVGVNGTHATINDLMADGDIANIKRVLVTTPQTLTTTQVIDQDDMEFIFKPQAVHSQGSGLNVGIQITSDRVTIDGGRFTDFTGGGTDTPIQLTAAASNCIIRNARFNNNEVDVDDQGTNNGLFNNITEV